VIWTPDSFTNHLQPKGDEDKKGTETTAMTTVNRPLRLSARRFQYCLAALALVNAISPFAAAQDTHSHAQAEAEMSLQQAANANTLLRIVRDATDKFQDVRVAEAQGYALQFGCVTGDDPGAVVLHYGNGDLVNNAALDPTRPQIVIYEPRPDGTLKLI